MKATVGFLLALALCVPSSAESSDLETLATSRDRQRLETAAVAVASSNEPHAIARLQELLGSREFLARLDNLNNPQEQIVHLSQVFLALQFNPSPATEQLCIRLAGNPAFTAIPARLNYLLPALAMVKPMSVVAADVFRRTNPDGFFSLNGPLLVANGSPRALDVFRTIAGNHDLDVASRIDVIRRSVIPHRTSASVLRCISQLLDTELEPPIHIALLESVFEYMPAQWFGRISTPPAPPPWETASAEAQTAAIAVAEKGLRRADLPAPLRSAIVDTIHRMNAITASHSGRQSYLNESSLPSLGDCTPVIPPDRKPLYEKRCRRVIDRPVTAPLPAADVVCITSPCFDSLVMLIKITLHYVRKSEVWL